MDKKVLTEKHPLIMSVFKNLRIHDNHHAAIADIEHIREKYITSKLSEDEPERIGYEKLWIKGLGVTKEHKKSGYKGHFWKVHIVTEGVKYKVEMTRLNIDISRHPQKKNLEKQRNPNWGHHLLRKIKKDGRKYCRSLEEAKEIILSFSQEFSNVIVATETKMYFMVFRKSEDGNKNVSKWVMEVAEDERGVYLFIEKNSYNSNNKPKEKKEELSNSDLLKEAEYFSRYLFGNSEVVELKIATCVMAVLRDRENRRSLKLNEQNISTECVYHFTSIEALKNILETKTLWLTDLAFVNDLSEIEHGRRKILSFFERESDHNEICSKSLKYLDGPSHLETRTYGLSFSESCELSNQWQAYGNNGDGIAIGFNRELLFNCNTNDQQLFFSKVHYNDSRKDQIICSIVEKLTNVILPAEINECSEKIAKALDVVAAFLKHNGFHAEKEWRLIHTGSETYPVEQRQGRSSGVLYISLNMVNDLGTSVENLISSIVIGPGKNTEDNRRDVDLLLQLNKLKDISILNSNLPLYN